MIVAVDVYYSSNSGAVAAAVVFSSFTDCEPHSVYISKIDRADDYVPGQFYKRELPCIMSVLQQINEEIDTIIIDGYVDPGNKPGLGRYLWDLLERKIPVIGVAKSFYMGTEAVKVLRGRSRQPLYITSAGMEIAEAAARIEKMAGKFRIPSILKLADQISRTGKYKPDISVNKR